MTKHDASITGAINRRSALKSGAGAIAAAIASSSASWAQTPRRGGTLRMSNGGDPPDFDVHQSATYLTQFIGAPCYSTLLRIDPNDQDKLLPDLAEKYDVSTDGKTVTFQISQRRDLSQRHAVDG